MRRTRPRISRVLLLLSVALAVVATLAAQARLSRLEARAVGSGRPVVVAATGLPRGTVLEPEMLTLRRIPTTFVPPGAMASPDQAVGRTLAAEVAANEPITDLRLAAGGGPVAALIPAGFRAVPVAAALPASALRPGDRVDVLATFATGGAHTETVVPGAEIVTVLPGETGDAGGPGTVTLILLVGPESAEALAFARTFADLSVALVSPDDESVSSGFEPSAQDGR
jgi:pilus assembly protein CpaB